MAPIPKKIAYPYSFEKLTQNLLPSFSIDDVEKFDLLATKTHSTYFINSMILLRHLVVKNKLLNTFLRLKTPFG